MIGLFSIAIIGFAVNFAKDNNAAVDISNDEQISNLYAEQKSNLSSFGSQSESTYESILGASVEAGQTTPKGGQFGITPLSSLSVVKNILKVGYIKIFGSDSNFGVFLTALISVLVFTFALLIWKAWIGRIPD
jgi:type IV secretory pathway VirB6-like protein